jgi:PAS domain S-box-containing protein
MTEIYASDNKHNNDYSLRKIIEKNIRMATLVESLESGILLEGSNGNLIQVNNSFLDIVSSLMYSALPSEEYSADFFHNILSKLIQIDDYYADIEAVKENTLDSHIDEIKFRDGRIFLRTLKRLYVNKEPKGFLWKFKDITVRKELENNNVELESIIHALSSCQAVGVYMDYSGYRFVNNGLVDILGISREKIVEDGLQKYVDVDLNQCSECYQVMSPQPDKYIQVVSDTSIVSGRKANIVSLRDVTDKMMLQKSLEENEDRFRNIFMKNMAVMLIFDPETLMITDANSAALEYYGYSLEELRSMQICDITRVPDMDACFSKLKYMVQDKTGSRIPVQQVLSNGDVKDVEMLMTPLDTGTEPLLFVIVEDVSERLKYERELVKINKNLQKLVHLETEHRRRHEELLMEKMRLAEMGEMVGNIAHQWRQPLTTLGILIQDLQDASEFGELNEDYINDLVETGMGQIDYMSKTIDDFRDFFKPSKEAEIFDVKSCVSQVISILLPQFKKNEINVKVKCVCDKDTKTDSNTDVLEICEKHSMHVSGYVNEFKQVLLNLLSNSKDALEGRDNKRIDINSSFAPLKHQILY